MSVNLKVDVTLSRIFPMILGLQKKWIKIKVLNICCFWMDSEEPSKHHLWHMNVWKFIPHVLLQYHHYLVSWFKAIFLSFLFLTTFRYSFNESSLVATMLEILPHIGATTVNRRVKYHFLHQKAVCILMEINKKIL
jgi:hypothetical protein